VADRTQAFLREHADDRFLCVAGFHSPHSPWRVPKRFLDQYDREALSVPEFPPEVEAEREAIPESDDPAEATYSDEELRAARHGYYAMVTEVDHYVGRILDTLDELGLREDTLVVFTSDHGEYLGEHLRYSKWFPGEDPVSRVPLVVSGPGVESPGRTESGIVELVDIVPTILDSVGRQVPPSLGGESMCTALAGEEFSSKGAAPHEHSEGKSLRTERYQYVRRADGSEELYDLDREFGAYRDQIERGTADEAVLSDMRDQLLDRTVEIDLLDERGKTYWY
jgi:arylsulfatase A-like enzyme